MMKESGRRTSFMTRNKKDKGDGSKKKDKGKSHKKGFSIVGFNIKYTLCYGIWANSSSRTFLEELVPCLVS